MRVLILCALAVACGSFPRFADAADAKKPNVLFIAIDDLNHWVGYLGRNPQTRTPNLDRMAEAGTRFTRSYCAAPVCNPSRAALLSGMRPSTTGVYENDDDWRTVISEEQTLPSAFRRAGYSVRGAGKIYHGAYERPSEWDDYLTGKSDPRVKKGTDGGVGGIRFAPLDCEDKDLGDYEVAEYAIRQLEAQHDRPFFLAVGFRKPHMPWNVPRKYYDMFPLDSIELPPTTEQDLADIPPAGVKMAKPDGDHRAMLESGRWKEAVQAYLATVAFCDAMVGRVWDAFQKSPHRDNTIVVLWSDHGWHLGEKEHWRKFALWEEATRAPMLWIVPGVTKPGSVCERTVDYMSVFPTLTDLTGIEKPAHVEGKSIRPLLANAKAEWNSPAVTTYMYENHAARSEGWRYIRYADGSEELYDETSDPYEWTNLAGRTEFAEKKAELARHLPTGKTADISDSPKYSGRKDKNPGKQNKGKKKAAAELE